VGRIRYLGVLLYDADRLTDVAGKTDAELVSAQRAMILDPFDPAVVDAARKNGVPDAVIDSARRSPVYRFVKEWEIALPLHPEYRTLPMLFYVPPLLPAMAQEALEGEASFFTSLEKARLPLKYLASLFSAGNEEIVKAAYRKLMAVRLHRRSTQVGDLPATLTAKAMAEARLGAADADAIYRLTSLASMDERIVIPPMMREGFTEPTVEPQRQNAAGFAYLRPPPGR
jgi:nitrate reductase beta subunit